MRVAITGATGNVGASLVDTLAAEPQVERILGIERRHPALERPKTEWRAAHLAHDDLSGLLEAVDAVVHLAWLIQPTRDEATLHDTNVRGTERLLEAVADAGVRNLVVASSVGAYAPAPVGLRVDESWPATGIPTSSYSRHKAEMERLLDAFEVDNPQTRVVRLRPALTFKRESASEQRRLFAGPLAPGWLLGRLRLPVVPLPRGLRAQAVHTEDVAEAYRLALLGDARGAFNIAAEPTLDPAELAGHLGGRPITVPPGPVRGLVSATWRLRLHPTSPGWLDLGLRTPLMSSARAHAELGWSPRWTALEALSELRAGLRDGAGARTPPLEPGGAGRLRFREWRSGVGARSR